MLMRVSYGSAADLAKELADVWAKRGRVARAWPYNRWKWDESETWWIVPAPDRPAFRYAKIIVSSSPRLADSDHLFVGLYVEKGISGPLASAGYYPEDWILKPSWRWCDVVADLASGSLAPALATVSQRISGPVAVTADAHVPVVKPSSRPPHDVVAYETVNGIALTPTASPLLATDQRFLKHAAAAATIPELANSLRTIAGGDTAWINLYVGRSVEKSAPNDTSAVDPDQLTDRLLEPLSPWVR